MNIVEQLKNIFSRLREIEKQTPDSVVLDEGATLERLFLKHDNIIVGELFPLLAAQLSSNDFERKWVSYYQQGVAAEKEQILDDVKKCRLNGKKDSFYTDKLLSIEKLEQISSFGDFRTYLDWLAKTGTIKDKCKQHRYLNDGADGEEYISKHYFLLKLAEVLYQQFIGIASPLERFDRKKLPLLESDYQAIGIDLTKTDHQFAKYGLLSLDEHFRIANTKEGQAIVDNRIKKRYAIDVPESLLAAIESAKDQGLLGCLSFHVDNITTLSPALEGVEYGAIFDFDALKLPDMTRLFDDERYENSLWIQIDKKKSSMTFEELLEDFGELNDQVITQVLHLELDQVDGEYIITHIDHEYILYSLLDYAERQRNGKVKGHAKLKTFKIDGAKIPLKWQFDGKLFLYLALNAYFKNTALIREYFGKIQEQS